MYTMYTRELVLGAVVLMSVFGAASCGDDAAVTDGQKCDPGPMPMNPMMQVKSMPHSDNDPCPQNAMGCPYPMYTAITVCMPEGVWNPSCSCVPTASLTPGGSAGNASQAMCGNGTVEMGEDCDGTVPATVTCATMMPGTTGTITCNAPGTGASACKYNVVCMNPMPPDTGGTSGGMP
jgi:hypothetical protein